MPCMWARVLTHTEHHHSNWTTRRFWLARAGVPSSSTGDAWLTHRETRRRQGCRPESPDGRVWGCEPCPGRRAERAAHPGMGFAHGALGTGELLSAPGSAVPFPT